VVLTDVLKSPGLNVVMEDHARSRTGGSGRYDSPGLTGFDRYNHNDNNWWCAWEADRHARDLDDVLTEAFGDLGARTSDLPVDMTWRGMSVRAALNTAIRGSYLFNNIDAAELKALSRVACAPKLLAERVIRWVEHRGWFETDDGKAEALANAVAATRWGCTRNGSHARYSRRAFALLHGRYPQSEAAARTPYWFGCPLAYRGECPAADVLGTRGVP
jgi:hypothetical protein